MAPKNNKPAAPKQPTAPKQPAAKVAPAAQPKVNPTTLSTPQIYSGEQERKAALAEVTNLRRQYDTTTAAGAKAFAASKEAQAALARLDAAKSAVGMRTSAQDLQALNTVSGQGQTKALNAPSTQYFQSVYSRPEAPPTWAPPKKIGEQELAFAKQNNYNYDNARYDWVWSKNPKTGQDQWVLGIVGALKQPPVKPETLDNTNFQPYVSDLWMSGTATVSEIKDLYDQFGAQDINVTNPKQSKEIAFQFDEIVDAIPDLDYSEYQEILYQLALERDTNITVEDVVNKYNEIYGEGK